MTALADMEELLASISNRLMVDYMREALTCYGAGAYRGCIVMSYLALFDDIRLKLAELARVNSTAKALWQEVEKRSGAQEVFESYMADQLLKSALLTKAEHKQLEIIRDIRNRAAHPSGVHAKAEEARYVYRTVIDNFLSQQLLKTTHAVDAVLGRLDKANLFPTTNLEEVVAIARAELEEIHPAAYPYLLNKLIEAHIYPDSLLSTNAGRMIVALAAFRDASIRGLIQKALLEGESHDSKYANLIGRVIAADANVLKGLKPDAVLRVHALLEASADNPTSRAITQLNHPLKQFVAMVNSLGENSVLFDYPSFDEKVIVRYTYTPGLLEGLDDAPSLRGKLVNIWVERAGSSTFDIANAFADAMPQLDNFAEIYLTDKEALKLVIAVVQAAKWGAWHSEGIRNNQFEATPKIAGMAVNYAAQKPKDSAKLVEQAFPGTTLDAFLKDELNSS
jgi:hypothetical protein